MQSLGINTELCVARYCKQTNSDSEKILLARSQALPVRDSLQISRKKYFVCDLFVA